MACIQATDLSATTSVKEEPMTAAPQHTSRSASLSAAVAAPDVAGGADARWIARNPTGNRYERVPLRLGLSAPNGDFAVTADGRNVPFQVDETSSGRVIWVSATLPPGGMVTYATQSGPPPEAAKAVRVSDEGGQYVLDNGIVAVRVPSGGAGGLVGPIGPVRLPDGNWVGRSVWSTSNRLTRIASRVAGDGTVFGKIRLRYEFEGSTGPDGKTPAFAEVDVVLGPGWKHIEIAERHAMAAGSYWEFDASAGWKPDFGRSARFSEGPGSGAVPRMPAQDRPLTPGGLPYQDPELFINLQPRWNQHLKDGWFFCATDGRQAVGVMPVRAGRWIWPHDNTLHAVVKETGDYAGIRCRTQRGARLWWLLPGAADSVAGKADLAYMKTHAFESLDKLNHEFILDWPGMQRGGWFTMDPYNNNDINPTGVIRAKGRQAAAAAGQPGDLTTLYSAQVLLHPDTYGSCWDFWSPENPNFFTDFMIVPVMQTTGLKDHPRFAELREAAEMVVREDIYHSVTLPGMAGQECPGYMADHWMKYSGILKAHLNFDVAALDRAVARDTFHRRISQPDGHGKPRRILPMGDTHPAKDGPAAVETPPREVAAFETRELPGFGVIFSSRPGTERETYLSFKSGPNRGHYHGDQLSFHYCADARPVAVDHFCSYKPRAGQEHLHNRMAFHTDSEPYLNMDGYERLVAFKTSKDADVAIGQVESDRLRHTEALPPENWDQRHPRIDLAEPLVYRRTVVFVKGGACDYFVLRDQWKSAQRDLRAAWCVHVRDNGVVALEVTDTEGAMSDGTVLLRDAARDFGALGVKPGWVLHWGSMKDRQDRYEVRGVEQHALTLDRGIGAAANRAYVLFRPSYTVDGSRVELPGLTVAAAGPAEVAAKFFPWKHLNGGGESTQGVRLETSGASGELITVLHPGKAPPVQRVPGGVRLAGDEIVFAGGIALEDAVAYVTVKRDGKPIAEVSGRDLDLDRPQGDIGLFVPDAGYPFGDIPNWLIRQRLKRPAWCQEYLRRRADRMAQ
jgi:hypothetical protein